MADENIIMFGLVLHVAGKILLFLTDADPMDESSILTALQAGQEHVPIQGSVTILTYGIGKFTVRKNDLPVFKFVF